MTLLKVLVALAWAILYSSGHPFQDGLIQREYVQRRASRMIRERENLFKEASIKWVLSLIF